MNEHRKNSLFFALIAVTFIAVLTLTSCDRVSSYTGDGVLTDNGAMASGNRYLLVLGPVDLSKTGVVNFRIAGLPREEYTVGLSGVDSCVADARTSSLRIGMTARVADDVVFSEEAPLSEWDHASSGLWYRLGAEQEIPKGGGVIERKRTGEKTDGGWGTYFSPRRDATYSLAVNVVKPHAPAPCSARVVLLGGGWK